MTGDRLYAEEFDAWAQRGAVDIRYAFSREEESHGCKHVQDRMMRDKEDIFRLWDEGAKVSVCGSPPLAEEFGKMARQLLRERATAKGKEIADGDVER